MIQPLFCFYFGAVIGEAWTLWAAAVKNIKKYSGKILAGEQQTRN